MTPFMTPCGTGQTKEPTSDEKPGPDDEAGAGDAGQDGRDAGEARSDRGHRTIGRGAGEGDPQRQLGTAPPEDRPLAGRSQRRRGDRKSVVSGKSVTVRVDLGGRRTIKKNKRPDRIKKKTQ